MTIFPYKKETNHEIRNRETKVLTMLKEPNRGRSKGFKVTLKNLEIAIRDPNKIPATVLPTIIEAISGKIIKKIINPGRPRI